MEKLREESASEQKVLLVDDERTVRQTLALIFKSRGYQTRAAESAEEALELIAGWTPDVAILDVGLPQMNGVELATLIRSQCPSCHILLFSGRPDSEELIDEAQAGGKTFEITAKPVHPDFLLNWVGKRLQPE
jgi:DNA-binding response OmpR family regulator